MENHLPRSRYFQLHLLKEGVYAAIGPHVCGAGLIDLGGRVVVFDTFIAPQAAQDLRQAAAALFGRAPQLVVNSHWHNDHTWGNQAFFGQAQILSSACTCRTLAVEGPKEMTWYKANLARRMAELRALRSSASPARQEEIRLFLGEYELLAEDLPRLKVCLPEITFDQDLGLHGDRRSARLINFENGHTACDTVLYLPQDGVLFAGDLLFVRFHPYLADGDPQGLRAALVTLSQMDVQFFVPGHGPVGERASVIDLINYLDYCADTAQALIDAGPDYQERIAGVMPVEMFQNWEMPSFFSENIGFLCKKLAEGAEKK